MGCKKLNFELRISNFKNKTKEKKGFRHWEKKKLGVIRCGGVSV